MGGFLHALAADLPERLADNAGPAPGKVTLTMRLPPAAEEPAIGPLLAKLDPAISTPASSAYADPFGDRKSVV